MKITAGLKAAAKALVAGPKAESFRAGGKLIECPHCENVLFHKKKISLNTAFSSLANLEWTDREACVLVCANCSRIEWFYDDLTPEKA
jgi:uncharacterized protein